MEVRVHLLGFDADLKDLNGGRLEFCFQTMFDGVISCLLLPKLPCVLAEYEDITR
jgi:hypothetical protein